jgi:uncharacterized protein with PIN domain
MMDQPDSRQTETSRAITKVFTFRLYAELNDFLSPERRQKAFTLALKTPVTVREAIESLGVPLSEVDLILINSRPSAMNRFLHDQDYVSVYPVFESFDLSGTGKLRHRPLRESRFILDAHLGKLAKYLRMLGFDTLYQNDFGDREIIDIAQTEKRIILTRDKLLLQSKKVNHGYFVRSTEKHAQLIEIVKKFDLRSQFRSFTRCMTCNADLIPKIKQEIIDKIDADTARIYDEFFYCPSCNKVFWKGSHFERMEQLILSLIE